MNAYFSADEIDQLRHHGIEIFADRVIFEAQPPLSSETMDSIEALCAGPLPEPLRALWCQTAGGRMDYDLTLTMNQQEEAISWVELFYNESNAYKTLIGWIEHEQKLAKEAAEEAGNRWDGKLRYLPFGGFEYCDRIYCVVAPGSEYGHIEAWKQGLPPAWTHQLNEDGLCTLGKDLYSAFRLLTLHEDPLHPAQSYFAGESFLDYVKDRRDTHFLENELAEKLIEFYRKAIIDWKTPLAEKTIANNPKLANLALLHAIETDDADLVLSLVNAGVTFVQPLQGSALPTDSAMRASAWKVTQTLIDAGAKIDSNALQNISINESPPVSVIIALMESGAEPSVDAIVKCAASGAPNSALAIAKAYAKKSRDLKKAFVVAKKAMLKDLKESLKRVKAKQLAHYLGEKGLEERITNINNFKL
jgi:hypothetical protein